MKLYLRGHSYRYAVEQMLLTLFPDQRPEYPGGELENTGPMLELSLIQEEETLAAQAVLRWEGQIYTAERLAPVQELTGGLADDRVKQRILRLAFYDAGVAALGTDPPWGALTGVRPVKLPTLWLTNGKSRQQAKEQLTGLYRVSQSRAELALDCAQVALQIKNSLPRHSLSLYLGIPFCPTRCAYCSFISSDVKGALAMVEPYVDLLCREIELAGKQLVANGLNIFTAYIGGGTPTTLTAGQLDRVLTVIERCLPMNGCMEFTVEAGRPDTITGDKLDVLRAHGVHRISINPQTMEDNILELLGRTHTAAQIQQSMTLAETRFQGFVNMDLIAGLPGDTPEGFDCSLDWVLSMSPANVTVHTLALKRGSRLAEQGGRLCPPQEVADMLALAESRLRKAGYQPYYLYRQKYMSGSFENVGWCLPGTECVYNVIMMEELQSVMSLGAGGITKLVNPDTGKITRLANPKYPHEYLGGWDKLSDTKKAAVQFQTDLMGYASPEGCPPFQ